MNKPIELPQLTCQQCGHVWNPRKSAVIQCPNRKCQSKQWNQPKEEVHRMGNTWTNAKEVAVWKETGNDTFEFSHIETLPKEDQDGTAK